MRRWSLKSFAHEIITDFKSFELLALDWVNLYDPNKYSIFQSFEFNYFSWKYEFLESSDNLIV